MARVNTQQEIAVVLLVKCLLAVIFSILHKVTPTHCVCDYMDSGDFLVPLIIPVAFFFVEKFLSLSRGGRYHLVLH